MSARILVTGSRSGFGNFVCSQLRATGLTRENSSAVLSENSVHGFDTIIHCANDDKSGLLLEALLKLPHKRFVFLSSCDVYPDDGTQHSEADVLDSKNARNAYSEEKIITDLRVLRSANNPICIRTVSLLGPGHCGDNLKRLLNEEVPALTLAKDSTWNFVTYEELFEAIQSLLSSTFVGPINFCRSKSVAIIEVASFLKKDPSYGGFSYHVGQIDNRLAAAAFPNLKQSSLEAFQNWYSLNN
jgi:dTDP-4-dehydrorhamnose reductase